MKNVLLLKAGETALHVRQRVGDYDTWFARATAPLRSRYRLHRVNAYLGEKLPDARGFDAVWMTGSPLSVILFQPWMQRAADYLREAGEQGVPVLGVCFGHQLLGHAWGSKVVTNPRGREVGTIEVRLTPEGTKDPLFEGIFPTFNAQSTHEDIVAQAPEGTTVLASNANTAIQALAYAKNVRGVQFHPELEPDGMKAVIEARYPQLDREAVERGMAAGQGPARAFASVAPTPSGQRILANFLRHFT